MALTRAGAAVVATCFLLSGGGAGLLRLALASRYMDTDQVEEWSADGPEQDQDRHQGATPAKHAGEGGASASPAEKEKAQDGQPDKADAAPAGKEKGKDGQSGKADAAPAGKETGKGKQAGEGGALASPAEKEKGKQAGEGGALASPAEKEKAPVVQKPPGWPKGVHIIGDTHGHFKYFVWCLLSTGVFMVDERDQIQWSDAVKTKAELAEGLVYRVYILGDMVDRGPHSKQILQTAKRLSEEAPADVATLTVLLGNHELSMFTYENKKYANPDGDLSMAASYAMLTAKDGENASIEEKQNKKLVDWLAGLPVIAKDAQTLMMHGGLSEKTLGILKTDDPSGYTEACEGNVEPEQCWDYVRQTIHTVTETFLTNLLACYQKPTDMAVGRCILQERSKKPKVLDRHDYVPKTGKFDDEGILWLRKFSLKDDGAGTPESCEESSKVAKRVGCNAMALAHSTHAYISAYCGDSSVPVYMTDTHREDCKQADECDFDPSKDFHPDGFNPNTTNIAQALYIGDVGSGSDKALPESGLTGDRAVKACFASLGDQQDLLVAPEPGAGASGAGDGDGAEATSPRGRAAAKGSAKARRFEVRCIEPRPLT